MPNVCINCDRYKPIDEFISKQGFKYFFNSFKAFKEKNVSVEFYLS